MVEGFKNTEVGIIPEDWDLKSIEELCVPSGLVRGPFGGALKKEFFVPYGYKVYEQKNAIYSDVTLGRYYIDYLKFNELRRFEIKELLPSESFFKIIFSKTYYSYNQLNTSNKSI